MPPDEESDDDAPAFGAPLPPDDRLWRHPSELGPVAGFTERAPEGTPGNLGNRGPSSMWGVAIVAGLVGAALSLGVVAVAGVFQSNVVEKPVVEKVPVRSVADLASAQTGVVAVTRSVAPAIVRIDVATSDGPSSGSGVLFRNDGYLVTDSHLLASAQSVQVVLSDGRTVPGTIVGSDKWTEVGVVKIDAGAVPVAMFGSAAELQVGQTAIAIGSPVGSSGGPSVTVGVVSALGKKLDSLEGVGLRDMIETDATAANGSAGGALCDDRGVVIGLMTSVARPETDAELGAAAPIDVVRAVAEDIIATGSARHSWLGIEGADADGGAKVTKVVDGSPAERAGLADEDVIAKINDTNIASMTSLAVALRGHHAGETIRLEVTREGQNLTMEATLDDYTPN